MGSDLDSVMSSLRQTDEKYQDASVSELCAGSEVLSSIEVMSRFIKVM